MKKIHIYSLGCALRNLESVKLENYFKLNGYQITENFEEADLIAFYSCGVIKHLEDTTIGYIEKYLSLKKKVLFMGCVPKQSPYIYNKYSHNKNVIIIPTLEHYKVDDYFPEFKIKYKDLDEVHFIKDRYNLNSVYKNAYLPQQSEKKMFRVLKKGTHYEKAFKQYYQDKKKLPIIIVSNGCNQNCAFCTIRYAIGKHKSKPIEKILSEYNTLINNGHKIIAIDGDDPGNYGLDINNSFSNLLDKLYELSKDKNVFLVLDELNPIWFNKYINKIKEHISNNFIKRILLPVQSFSPNVLKEMNRYNNIDIIKQNIKDCNNIKNDFSFCIHILFNFPPESIDDLKLTLNDIKEMNFDRVRFHSYFDSTDENFKNDEELLSKKIELIKKELANTKIAYDLSV